MKEGNFDISENGITLQGVDPSFVALIQLSLRADGFSSFRADHPISLGLNLEQICKVLKCASQGDAVYLKCADARDVLEITFKSDSEERVSNFKVRLLEIDADAFGVPAVTYSSVVKMPSNEFQRIVRELNNISDTVAITIDTDGVKFAADSHTSSAEIHIKPTSGSADEGQRVQVKVEEKLKQILALRHLNSFAKASVVSDSVVLMISEGVPFVCEYKISNLGHLRFFLAPKIEED